MGLIDLGWAKQHRPGGLRPDRAVGGENFRWVLANLARTHRVHRRQPSQVGGGGRSGCRAQKVHEATNKTVIAVIV